MSSKKFLKFGIIAGTIIVMNIIKNWILFNVILSVYASTIGEGTLATVLALLTTSAVIAAITMIPLYWEIRENSEERRRFLSNFAEQEYNRANLRKYLKDYKVVRQDAIVVLIAALIVLFVQYIGNIVYSPIYLFDFVVEFAIFVIVYLAFEKIVRLKLYDKWESARLHK